MKNVPVSLQGYFQSVRLYAFYHQRFVECRAPDFDPGVPGAGGVVGPCLDIEYMEAVLPVRVRQTGIELALRGVELHLHRM